MGCRWCVHWVSEDAHPKDFGQSGECRRYPRPEKTVSEYRCGEFVCETNHWASSHGSNLMQMFYERMHDATNDRNKERNMRLEFEKKLRALRKQLKTPGNKVSGGR